ncbi:orotidine-5'-phosphate decarboxylase [Salinibius halmophilus]|uniref:orotidine-5'-phosphate decarboxylase n=1 Tax=Salinibius halmophilus TaxID=1853216 RepID=UPI000E674F97|nr:orotidine-5'-phosphate decarboxylase [Salinibius halmophilus]
MSFSTDLRNRWQQQDTLVCVGIDPDIKRLPEHLRSAEGLFEWGMNIIDATAPYACAFKPQIAHFAALGAEDILQDLIKHVHRMHPGLPVILDSKRGDIGSTAERYAREAFERFEADAVTVNPYLGFDGIEPFTEYQDKGVIVLCRTSNPSAAELQGLTLENGNKLYQQVAITACEKWNQNNNLALVVGATWPDEMGEIRQLVGDMPFLVPGLGAQGGDAEAVLQQGKTADGTGLMISSSRGIIFASEDETYAESAGQAAMALRDLANQYR